MVMSPPKVDWVPVGGVSRFVFGRHDARRAVRNRRLTRGDRGGRPRCCWHGRAARQAIPAPCRGAGSAKKAAAGYRHAPETPEPSPKELVSASELIQQQQAILAINGENQRKRQNVRILEQNHFSKLQEVERLTDLLQAAQEQLEKITADLEIANTDALTLFDQSTEKLEQSITQVDEINRKVRANFDKDKAEQDAAEYRNQYDAMSAEIDDIRKEKSELLNNADLPLSGLSVADGELIYNGQRWDNMSGSDQLKVSTAIVRKLKPSCGFILLDKLEQMDMVTLNEFGKWLEEEGLQAIATRVSTGDECSIIIEDGYVVGEPIQAVQAPVVTPVALDTQTWKAGEF